MPDDPILTKVAAVSIIRRLSGTRGYPFREEGEERMAEVLMQFTAGVTHAQAAVDEYDGETCPTVEALRATCKRLAEPCRNCHTPMWAHGFRGCKRYLSPESAPLVDDRGIMDAAEKIAREKLMVPMIPGVRWEICLQIQCLRIAVEEAYKDQEYYLKACREYPEAMADIRAKRDPDPKIVEKRYRELHPNVFMPAAGMGALSALDAMAKQANRDLRDAESKAQE